MKWRTPVKTLCVLFILAPALLFAGTVGAKEVLVRKGDNLGKIAERNSVSVQQLRAWNPKRIGKDDMIRVGMTLRIRTKQPPKKQPVVKGEDKAKKPAGPTWMGHYRIRAGDTLGRVARRLGVTVAHLRRYNKLRGQDRIRAGAVLKFEKPGQRPVPLSIGRPTQGSLRHGRHLGKGKGYRLRFPSNAYGVVSVNRVLRRCSKHVARRFPGTADILVGDISRATGRLFPPHGSHQSGRDVDLGYYIRGNKQNITLHLLGAYELDYAKNWTMLRCLLTVGRVVRIYMDTAMQKGYAKYLRSRKLLPEATIKRLFEAVSSTPRKALVRHSKGHDTHLHVRFACEQRQPRCQEERDDQVFALKPSP